jgi:hypothetical protein
MPSFKLWFLSAVLSAIAFPRRAVVAEEVPADKWIVGSWKVTFLQDSRNMFESRKRSSEKAREMFRSDHVFGLPVLSLCMTFLLAQPSVADELISLPSGVELFADSDETRNRLLKTELEVSQQLVDMARGEFKRVANTREKSPQQTPRLALIMFQRIRATMRIMQLCGSRMKPPSWLQRDELILQVLLQTQEVERTQTELQEAERGRLAESINVYVRRNRLLDASTSLLSMQLELAKATSADPAELAKVSNGWVEVEQRAKLLKNKLEDVVDSNRLESPGRIKESSEETQRLIEKTQRLIHAVWELYNDQIPPKRDAAAILSYLDDIGPRVDAWLPSVDAKIADILPKEKATKLRSLQIKKLVLVREMLRRMEYAAMMGLESYDAIPFEQHLDAELELCETREERIARLRRHVKRLGNAVKDVEAAHGVGRASGHNLHQLKVQVVDAEIRLLREQSRGGSK